MTPTSVTIQFEKKISDSNYGHESVTVFVAAELDKGESVVDVGSELQHRARLVADETLMSSPSLAVRRALVRQEPRPAHEDEL